jgi:hypothetical protein
VEVIRVNEENNKIIIVYIFFSLTGFPVLISRVVYTNAHLLHVGDAILSINNENISNLTHDEVINKLRAASGDQVNLTVQYMNNMAPYLRSTTSTARSSLSTIIPPVQTTSFTLPTPSSVRIRRQQNRMSAEYPSGYHRPGKQQQRLSLMLSDQQKVRINHIFMIDNVCTQYIFLCISIQNYRIGICKIVL